MNTGCRANPRSRSAQAAAWVFGFAFLYVWASPAAGSQEEPLRLTLRVDGGGYRTLDLIPYRIELTNTASGGVTLTRSIAVGGTGGAAITCRLPGSDAYAQVATSGGEHSGEAYEFVLGPGKSLRRAGFISLALKSATSFVLPPEGILTVQASYRHDGKTVHAPAVQVALGSSEGLPQEVKDLFATPTWHKLVLGDASLPFRIRRPYEEFYNSGKWCPQKDLLAYLAGRSFQRGVPVVETRKWIDPVTGEKKTGKSARTIPAYPSAIGAYKKAVGSTSLQIKARAQYRLAQCYLRQGDKPKALAALEGFPGLECDTELYEDFVTLGRALD